VRARGQAEHRAREHRTTAWPLGRGARGMGTRLRSSASPRSDVAVGGDVRFSECISGTNFTPTKSESEPVGAAANGAKRGETYNSLRAITISVYRVVLRAWHEKRFFRNAVRPPFVCGRVNRQTYERGVRQRGVRADDSASAGHKRRYKKNKTRTETSLRLRHPRKISLH